MYKKKYQIALGFLESAHTMSENNICVAFEEKNIMFKCSRIYLLSVIGRIAKKSKKKKLF